MKSNNQVQLVTYPNSLGGNLKELHINLQSHFNGCFQGGIHILPPFPSSGDRGFSPITYFEIDPAFGSWDDIKNLSSEYSIMLDLMVNHISRKSFFFQDVLLNGFQSEYIDLFLTPEKIFKGITPKRDDIDRIFLRRETPFSTYKCSNSNEILVFWTTFGKENPSEQVDLDVASPQTLIFFEEVLQRFAQNGIKYIRLDAVGYISKKVGTSCFFVEPETTNFLEWFKHKAESFKIEILPEVHAEPYIQKKLSLDGFWTYDFILPFLVLHSILSKNVYKLVNYLQNRTSTSFTMLDCHDGIPIIPDLNGIVPTDDAKMVINHCLKNGANLSKVFSSKHQHNSLDVHQIRCTFFSAIDENEDAYICARAIQLFIPGIPQIYYVGLLAGVNDEHTILKNGDGREINRHNFSNDEIETATQRKVVQRLIKVIKLRNTHPALSGNFEANQESPHLLSIIWRNDTHQCLLKIDLKKYVTLVSYTDEFGGKSNQYL